MQEIKLYSYLTTKCIKTSLFIIGIFLFLMAIIMIIIPTKHTTSFDNYKKEELYDNRTFGYNIYKNPCTVINNNKKFRNYVNNNINCIHNWCVNNKYSCKDHLDDRMCYEVEHIIDKNGPELTKYCKNIAANMVMALGKWNKELGELTYDDYYLSKREKANVYGKDIMKEVYNKIKECNVRC